MKTHFFAALLPPAATISGAGAPRESLGYCLVIDTSGSLRLTMALEAADLKFAFNQPS